MKAPTHPDQQARLAALRRYDILDTPREADFDDIVALASHICGTPISVINLIDAERQWFKAETGLGVRETPLDTSICAHVILEQDFVEIADTLDDARMRDNPLCLADPGLRFYAGALLRSPDQQPIGTLCVLDTVPRVLNEAQKAALRALARQVVALLDLRQTVARSATLRKEIDHRVKNSLQAVGAFVSLERGTAGTDETRGALDRVLQQISIVATLHDQLGRDVVEGEVDLAPYLTRVASLLDELTPPGVSVAGTFARHIVTTGDAATVGTVVNELVINAVKHAFGHQSGTIRMSGERMPDGRYRLICADDAKLQPIVATSSAREGLGLAIIAASVQQLSGSMTTSRSDEGYRTELIF